MDMTKKLTKDLIEMYWERRCLWQVNSKEYKKRDLKKKAYQEMVVFLRGNGVKDANMKLVREKIQNLRRAMRKEKKRIDDSEGAYSPTLWYYDLLSFVNDQYEDTGPLNNEAKESWLIEVENIEDSQDEIESNVKAKKLTKQAVTELTFEKDDEFQALGVNFAAKLKRMTSTQQIFAELLIQKVLARGLLGKLNEAADITDTPSSTQNT